MEQEYKIIVDFSNKTITGPKLNLVQLDNNSSILNFEFKDDINNGVNISMKWKFPDGSIAEDQLLTVNDKKASYTIPNELLTLTGNAEFCLVWVEGEKVLTNTKYFNDIYIKGKYPDGTVLTPEDISLVNQVIGQLNDKILETNTAISEAETATNNANTQADYAEGVGNQLLEDKDNGVFDGPQGIQGEQGIQGPAGSDADVTKENVEAVLTGEINTHTHDYNNLNNKPVIPIATSDLTNDSGFIDNTVDDLTNYTKTSDINNALETKVKISDIIDDLNSLDANKPLSANQGKILKGYIDALEGSLIPQGNWNADTNTPDISINTTTGYFWIVSVAGNTDIGGITDWNVNDWVIKTETGWAKIDNTDKVFSVNNKTGNVIINSNDVNIDTINGVTYDSMQDYINQTNSAGYISGGDFSDNGDGSITVSAGTGLIRTTNDSNGNLISFDWTEDTNVTVVADNNNYISIDYNAGNPQIISSTTNTSNGNTIFNLGLVFREGAELHFFKAGQTINDATVKILQRFNATGMITKTSGGVVSEIGTRNLAVTGAVLFSGITKFTTSAIDTSVSDTFEYYYTDGAGGWQYISDSATQINNTQYDNGGTLTNLTPNRYRTDFVYLSNDGDLLVLMGTNNSSLTDAQNVEIPTSLPPHIANFSTLIAKVIVQKNGTNLTEVDNVSATVLSSSGTIIHNETTQIQGGTTDEYYHLTSEQLADVNKIDTNRFEIPLKAEGTEITLTDAKEDTAKVMLVEGVSTQDGIPDPNNPIPIKSAFDNGLTIWSHGKNLFDINEAPDRLVADLTYSIIDDVLKLEATGTVGAQYLVTKYNDKYKTNTDYTLSFKGKRLEGTGSRLQILVRGKKPDNSEVTLLQLFELNPVIGQEYNLNNSFNTGECEKLQLFIYNYDSTPVPVPFSNEYWNIQIEEGTSETTYESYISNETEVILPTGFLGASLPNDTADVIEYDIEQLKTKQNVGKIILDGTESWYLRTDITYADYNVFINLDYQQGELITNGYGYSTHFPIVQGNSPSNNIRFVDTTNYGTQITIEKSIVSNATELKAWLASNNVTAYYPLAEPIETNLDDIDITTYETTNIINTLSNPEPNFKIRYLEKW